MRAIGAQPGRVSAVVLAVLWALFVPGAARATSTSVYVANVLTNGAGGVSQYDIGAGGALSAKLPATVAGGDGPNAIAVSPDGKSVYVANAQTNGAGGVSQYDVGAGGALTPKSPATVAGGNRPFGIAVSPDGKSVYVTNFLTNVAGGVAQYDVGAGGALTPKVPATVAGGSRPIGIAVAPEQGPSASFTATAAPAGAQTLFSGAASSDPDGTIARYDWDFGDGSTAANGGPAPAHVYTKAGTYTVRLQVTDDGGCSTAVVFTGQTASCNDNPAAIATRAITVLPPTVSGLGVSPKKFSLAGRLVKGRCVNQTKKNQRNKRCTRPIELQIRYTVNGPVTVTFTLTGKAPGRKVSGRCVKQTNKNRKHAKCSRRVTIQGELVTTGKAGANSFMFNGTIGGHKLGPGTYQLTATPTGGQPQNVTFLIAG